MKPKVPTKKQQRPALEPQKLQQQYNILSSTDKQDPWLVISNLNKLYKVDRILLKHAYDNYADKEVMKNNKQYKNVQKFYRYVLDNLLAIQRHYLKDQLAGSEDQQIDNYQINKNSTSKFIRDQKEHFQQVFQKCSSKVNQDQTAINGQKLFQFVKQCFDTKFTQVLIEGEYYFQTTNKRKAQFEANIKSYCIGLKDMDEDSFLLENLWMEKDQILDLLSYWLKFNEDNDLYVLYCRTEQKLSKDIQYLKNQTNKNRKKEQKGEQIKPAAHPMKLQEQEITKIEEEIAAEQQQAKQTAKDVNSSQIIQNKNQKANMLDKLRKNKFVLVDNPKLEEQKKPKVLTKKQQLMLKIPQFFMFGCKRRYPLPKGTTFDQIQSESKTMNLQKFINFCNYFEISSCLSRELLSEIFKLNALNRLSIDEKRFTKIMQTIIQTDPKTIDLFLNKKSISSKLRSQAKLSNYKFILRPINGKSPEALQNELQEKKIVKSKSKQEKMNLYFLKKLKEKQRGQFKKQKAALSSRVLPESTNILELENIRDDSFDPEKFFNNDHDQLLDMYESKFQSSKDHIYSPAPLESILSKRLQRGNKIIRKINSTSLKNYE